MAAPYLAIGLFGKAKAEGDILDEYEFDDNSTNCLLYTSRCV